MEQQIQEWLLQQSASVPIRLQRLIRAAGSSVQPEQSVMKLFHDDWKENGWACDWYSLAGTDWQLVPELILSKPVTALDRLNNLIAIRKGSGGGRSLLMNGHVDVVPAGNPEQWHHDPFSGTYENGRIYGRGSADMLGGLLAMQLAIEAIDACAIPLKGDIIIAAVPEEECGGAGSAALMLQKISADAALIAEPTTCKLFPAQQGSQWFRLRVKGKAAHGGTRDLGVSSIHLACQVIQALEDLERKRHVRAYRHGFHREGGIAYPINIGTIRGGNWPSSVADETVMEGRYGLIPGETLSSALEEFEMALESLMKRNHWFRSHPVSVEWYGARWMPNELPSSHPWYQIWTGLPERHAKSHLPQRIVQAAPWGTDAGWLSHINGMPVMVYGPGEPEQAHQSNESIPLENILVAAGEIALAAIRWCNED